MSNQYTMKSRLLVEQSAFPAIKDHLNSFIDTVSITDVTKDREYRKKDIDLLWTINIAPTPQTLSLEIKADTYVSGNFFFETASNAEKGTPGCFMYTEADFVFYYFLKTGELYKLPMPATRQWFKENMNLFQERSTRTPCGGPLGHYTTIGRLVPIKTVMESNIGVEKSILRANIQ